MGKVQKITVLQAWEIYKTFRNTLYLCKYRFYEKKKIDLLLFLEPYQYECYDGS